jgi:dihydrofolate reductase
MPKLELGDLAAVAKAKEVNIPILADWVERGWDIVAPIPSCTLMFKQELPLMFPHDPDVIKVRDAIYDPFEYLMLRHKDGRLRTDFSRSLGKVAYQVPCHLRVQNIGLKTRDALQLVPDTTVEVIERCSGHDGTYAVKTEFHAIARKIARPVVNKVGQSGADHFVSDCPMAKTGGETGVDDNIAARGFENIGAWIMGRNMFGPVRGPWPDEKWNGWWGSNPPYHVPVFVLTNHPRDSFEMEGETVFHFVTEGIEAALGRAREAAGEKDIRLGGGVSTIRQYLAKGLIDEMHLTISPVLLGNGEHLLHGCNLRRLGYELVEPTSTPKATHVWIRKQE